MVSYVVDSSGNNIADSNGALLVSPTPAVARVGDSISHGGEITGGSPNVFTNAIATARLGDPVECAIHGAQTIVTASSTVIANGVGVARQGDLISCGATITEGSPNTFAGN